MLLPHDTTVVLTDGQKLRLFRNTGTEFQMALSELPQPDVHGEVEGAARHNHSGDDKKDHEEASFEAAVAKWLNHEITTGRIHKLFIVAPPRALGELRQRYGKMLQDKLVGELAKEHTSATVQVLTQALKDA